MTGETKTISLLRGERDNAGTRLLFLMNRRLVMELAARPEHVATLTKQIDEILNWLDRHDVKAEGNNYAELESDDGTPAHKPE